MKKPNSKWIEIRKNQKCFDCGRVVPAPSSMRVFTEKKQDEEKGYTHYTRTYLCADCHKYHREK